MIAVVDYHKGNLKSVERGLQSVGADARITDDPEVIKHAVGIVLPGVGAFTDAANAMRELGQMDLLRERIATGIPFLGICLGMHLLFAGGEEHAQGKPTIGLGVIGGIVGALPKTDEQGNAYKIPHVGWNSIEIEKQGSPLLEGIESGEHFYFTHSYAAPDSFATIATTTHSTTFPSVVQYRGSCYGVQFHPEKSSDAGAKLLRNFAELCHID